MSLSDATFCVKLFLLEIAAQMLLRPVTQIRYKISELQASIPNFTTLAACNRLLYVVKIP